MKFRINDVVRIENKLYVISDNDDDYAPWKLARIDKNGNTFYESFDAFQNVGIARLDDYMEFHNAKKVGERKVTQTFEIKWEK